MLPGVAEVGGVWVGADGPGVDVDDGGKVLDGVCVPSGVVSVIGLLAVCGVPVSVRLPFIFSEQPSIAATMPIPATHNARFI